MAIDCLSDANWDPIRCNCQLKLQLPIANGLQICQWSANWPIDYQLRANSARINYQWNANGVPIDFQWNANGVARECNINANWLPMECHFSANGLPMEYQSTTNGVPIDYHWSANSVSLDFQWNTNGTGLVQLAQDWSLAIWLVNWQSIGKLPGHCHGLPLKHFISELANLPFPFNKGKWPISRPWVESCTIETGSPGKILLLLALDWQRIGTGSEP